MFVHYSKKIRGLQLHIPQSDPNKIGDQNKVVFPPKAGLFSDFKKVESIANSIKKIESMSLTDDMYAQKEIQKK